MVGSTGAAGTPGSRMALRQSDRIRFSVLATSLDTAPGAAHLSQDLSSKTCSLRYRQNRVGDMLWYGKDLMEEVMRYLLPIIAWAVIDEVVMSSKGFRTWFRMSAWAYDSVLDSVCPLGWRLG